MVEVIGTGYSIAEIGEQLAWFGAAFRSSQHENGVVCCTPLVSSLSADDRQLVTSMGKDLSEYSCIIDFSIDNRHDYVQPVKGQCWHNLFRNPIVVKGYPILRRPELGTGLEIPLEMMATLAESRWVNTYKGFPYIKGFSTVLFPAKFNLGVIIWHMLYNPTGDRVPYPDGRVHHVKNISNTELSKNRHILGWCSGIQYYAGTIPPGITKWCVTLTDFFSRSYRCQLYYRKVLPPRARSTLRRGEILVECGKDHHRRYHVFHEQQT